jgi:hypothetical protein
LRPPDRRRIVANRVQVTIRMSPKGDRLAPHGRSRWMGRADPGWRSHFVQTARSWPIQTRTLRRARRDHLTHCLERRCAVPGYIPDRFRWRRSSSWLKHGKATAGEGGDDLVRTRLSDDRNDSAHPTQIRVPGLIRAHLGRVQLTAAARQSSPGPPAGTRSRDRADPGSA